MGTMILFIPQLKGAKNMVPETDYPFVFSAEELKLLRAIATDASAFPTVFVNRDSGEIFLTRPQTLVLGDRLTLRLAEVGFDEKYELTEEGKLIESLIDKLWLP